MSNNNNLEAYIRQVRFNEERRRREMVSATVQRVCRMELDAALETVDFGDEDPYARSREREARRRAKSDAKRARKVALYMKKYGDTEAQAHGRYNRRSVILGSLFNPVGGLPAMSRIHDDSIRMQEAAAKRR